VGKIGSCGAGEEVVAGIARKWQPDDARGHAGVGEALCKQVRRLLAGLVFILIKGNVDTTAWLAAKLGYMEGAEMGT